ncbi:WD40-repeat-containing domain protein [Helicostylum pulchrum]|uniref:F-box domain-containing protein n=1 Tax=Helicostylum pulchrum TaxID=562976 RepID=A0ABP9YGT0_9FUNG|nr:WD40-repeat-containing domain protein [Helicostylum pulchrum]
MDFFLQTDNVSSPPSSPPYRPQQRQRSSYIVDANNADVLKDKVRLDYMYKVKNTFQHLTFQQKYTFLTEILDCCDNQLLQYIYTFITPKLKIDFLKELPIELSLYIVSFIQDPLTLARASRVSRQWNRLTKDESTWKALCLQHQYVSTPSICYRDFFRRRYNIDTAWNQGGNVTFCQNEIGDGLATSLQMDDTYIVIGCDNNHIEVYNAKDGKYIRSLLGHEGGVWAIQFIKNEYNEHILVTGGCDRGARVWNLTTGELLFVLRGHVSTIRCLKVRDDKVAITGSRDTTLRIWDIKTGQLKHVCAGHQSSVRCLEISGNQFVSGSYDSTARLWDIETGQCIHTFTGHHSQIYAIAFDGNKVVTGSLDSNIRIWSAQTGACLITLQGHTSLVGHLQLFDHHLVSGGSDGCLRVWDMNTYECKHRISAHDNSVTCIQVDNKRIISGGSDGKVKLWNIETGTLIRSFTETARTVWKIQLNDTKAVVILQRAENTTTNSHHAVIELHDFDTYSPNFL